MTYACDVGVCHLFAIKFTFFLRSNLRATLSYGVPYGLMKESGYLIIRSAYM